MPSSIYDFRETQENDYILQLRNNIARDYEYREKKISRDYLDRKTQLDNYISDVREDTVLGKKRSLEDFTLQKQTLNQQLGQVAHRTFSRYMSKGSVRPTQVGLQNIAMRATLMEDTRNKFINQRHYDRSIEDFDINLTRKERDYRIDTDINEWSRDYSREGNMYNRDDQLLGRNYQDTQLRNEQSIVQQELLNFQNLYGGNMTTQAQVNQNRINGIQPKTWSTYGRNTNLGSGGGGRSKKYVGTSNIRSGSYRRR